MQMIYQIVTGVPLGIGAFLIYPISKKVGIKNLTVGGYSLVLIGSIIGWIFPDKMIPALIADRKSTRLNSSHVALSRMPSSA